MQHIDTAVFFWVNRGWHHPHLNDFFWAMTWLGVGWIQVLIALLVLALARKYGDCMWAAMYRRAWCPLLVAWLLSGLVVQAIKRTWNRPRPSLLEGALVAADERIFWRSFPSGHAATTAAMATVLALVFHRRYPLVTVMATGITLLVMLSRVYRGVHYPSDIIVGAIVGAVCGYAAWAWWSRRNSVVGEDTCEQSGNRESTGDAV